LVLDAKILPVNDDPWTHSKDSSKFGAFQLPQLLIKQSWIQENARFRAVVVRDSPTGKGVICSQSYISAHSDSREFSILEAAALSYNSILAVYYLLLTSGRFGRIARSPSLRKFDESQ
jgi:hypothetical protein